MRNPYDFSQLTQPEQNWSPYTDPIVMAGFGIARGKPISLAMTEVAEMQHKVAQAQHHEASARKAQMDAARDALQAQFLPQILSELNPADFRGNINKLSSIMDPREAVLISTELAKVGQMGASNAAADEYFKTRTGQDISAPTVNPETPLQMPMKTEGRINEYQPEVDMMAASGINPEATANPSVVAPKVVEKEAEEELVIPEHILKKAAAYRAAGNGEKALGVVDDYLKEVRSTEEGLRKEHAGQSKQFKEISDSYNRIRTLAKSASTSPGAGIALVYNFMRMQDPTSTVREGEYAAAENARGVPEGVRNLYNKLLTGTRLTKSQVGDFYRTAKELYKTQTKSQAKLTNNYQEIGKRYGVNPKNVYVDYAVDEEEEEPLTFNSQDIRSIPLHKLREIAAGKK